LLVPLGSHDQLVELERHGVTHLRVLIQEDHQECYDGRPGVDDELPDVAIVESGDASGTPISNCSRCVL
jgi:hypothetical protein